MTWRTTWQADRQLLEDADRILTELAEPPVDATSLMRDDDASSEPAEAPWLLHAYTEGPISPEVLAMLPGELGAPRAEELEDRDWVAHALEGLGLVEAGPFLLFGKHDRDKVENRDAIKLQVEANQAFGTGHHPTTAGCLEAVAELRGRKLSTILDVGTGSGVLAMAARRLWPDAVIVATDIDATSVAIAEENARTNAIGDIAFGVAAGTGADLIEDRGPYDLVFANILAGPLKELAPDILTQTKPGGHVILAGLLDEQEADVIEAYDAVGLTLEAKGGTARWPTLTMTRKAQINE